MGRKRIILKNRRKYLAIPFIFTSVLVMGCQHKEKAETVQNIAEMSEIAVEDTTVSYHSDTKPEECYICGTGKDTLLPLYMGQRNLGVINLNTFDLVPVSINQYDDSGNLIEKLVTGSSTHVTNTGEDGFFLAITEDVNRGYAYGQLSFRYEEVLDMEKAADHLCQECLNNMMDNCWSDTPMGMGVIDFSTGEVRLFEENISAFTFGDYYVSCDWRDCEEGDDREMSLLVFYCPERYQQ